MPLDINSVLVPVVDAPLTGAGVTGNAWRLANSPVTPGAYTNANITVDQFGRVTAAANGAAPGVNFQDAILQAGSETTLRIRYSGTIPTYTKDSNGQFRITCPAGTMLHKTVVLEFNNSNLNPSNEIILIIEDTDGAFYDCIVFLHDLGTGQPINPWTSGILDTQEHTAPGEITITIANANFVGAGGARVKFAI